MNRPKSFGEYVDNMTKPEKPVEQRGWTAKDVQSALVSGINAPFNFQRYLVVPNVYWGWGLNWEADLIALSPAGYANEIEIKVTVSDLKRDREKSKWRTYAHQQLIKHVWFAAPEAMEAELEEFAPEFAGIYVVRDIGDKFLCKKVRHAQRLDGRKHADSSRLKLARLGVMRWWSREISA